MIHPLPCRAGLLAAIPATAYGLDQYIHAARLRSR